MNSSLLSFGLTRIHAGRSMRFSRFFYLLLFSLASLLFPQSQSKEERVNTYLDWDQKTPAIAADEAGNYVIAWVSDRQDGELTGIFARMFDRSGVAKGPEFQVNTFWEHLQERPAVAMAGSGNFVVTWVSHGLEGETGAGVAARLFSKNGTPLTPEFRVNDFIEGYQGEPAVAVDGDGLFVIVWQSWEQDGDGFGIFARTFDRNGTPLSPEFQVNIYNLDDQFHPAVAADKEGNFMVVWSSYGQDGDKTGVYARRFSKGGFSLTPEFRVNFTALGWQDWPDIAMDGAGNIIFCWQSYQYAADSYEIFGRTYDKNLALISPEFKVNSFSGDWQVLPSVAADKEGNFVISWQSFLQDGDLFGIYAQVFNQQAVPQGPEFRMNDTILGSQESPDLIMFRRDNFVVVWQSLLEGSSGWDIYRRVVDGQSRSSIDSQRFHLRRETVGSKNIHESK